MNRGVDNISFRPRRAGRTAQLVSIIALALGGGTLAGCAPDSAYAPGTNGNVSASEGLADSNRAVVNDESTTESSSELTPEQSPESTDPSLYCYYWAADYLLDNGETRSTTNGRCFDEEIDPNTSCDLETPFAIDGQLINGTLVAGSCEGELHTVIND